MTAIDLDLKEALEIIEDNGLERDVFMWLFHNSTALNARMTADDCVAVFEGILKGKDDLTKERLESLCRAYDTDLAEVLAGSESPKGAEYKLDRSKRYTGRVFKFRKEFGPRVLDVRHELGARVLDVRYFMQLQQDGEDRWVEIDGNLFVDLRAMTGRYNWATITQDHNGCELKVKTDARRERMFTTIAKNCYGLEV